ncbi:Y-family DNA polymerase [Shimia abyssi]|uniref:DNA-directed DNA polymerase n=1 Tax=Shimia abyssi TaxID=1662395 RepID=A0A2P8FKS4_9RHOB|nr:DNA polymerase Y family protein [Shimia abyssi]PSL22330.1 protein ImuB [Shimia abyssi]
MPHRRILSLWFPRLGAERLIRMERGTFDAPLAVLRDTGQMQVISSLNVQAEAEGLELGQPLRDAQAVCPGLITRLQNVQAEAGFLAVLRRWAGKFSPWVAEEEPSALVIDLTGCAHLFGGEAGLLTQVEQDCGDLGLTVRLGIADTLGAAWALARFAEQPAGEMLHRSGDDIAQEARATRSRAVKRRHWTRGGTPPQKATAEARAGRIAPVGKTRSALAELPVAGLRLDAATQGELARLGLRKIGDLTGQPRAGLTRRFGKGLVLRLDQALGSQPEPVSPAADRPVFAVRMTLPEPIGLEADVLAGVERLLPPLCERLKERGQGARVVRLQVFRADQTMQWVDVGLARASDDPERIRPLMRMKLEEIDAGFGIDMLRIEAVRVEPVHTRRVTGHLDAGRAVAERLAAGHALDDLVGRIGARIGLEQITRRHPASSHIPEKGAQTLHAAWSEPFREAWPQVSIPRPILLWRPEVVQAPDVPRLTGPFRWRGRDMETQDAVGPERIAPEWWLDEPEWRSGVRDYWRVTCTNGERLWLYYAHGGAMSSGWFCQGSFA